jgi:hypothetical protein
MADTPTIGERAAAALDAYWMRAASPPDQDTVMRAHAAITGRLSNGSYGKDWQTLLDDAMADIGCTVDWEGQAVRGVTIWGRPSEARSER